MFESLTSRLEQVFRTVKGQGKLSESNIQDALRDVRLSFLEADVHYRVVQDLIESVKERAIGQEVIRSLSPGQQFIKIVNEELGRLMGEQHAPLKLSGEPPVCILLVGLQGSGKTTTAGKLARFLKEEHRRMPLLVPADPYRPAAVEQLQTLGQQIGISVFDPEKSKDAVKLCIRAKKFAQEQNFDTLLIDSAGRLHIDDERMKELERIKEKIQPKEILLVVDAMAGQDAVNVASKFQERLDLDGVVLTKLDGDARGGAALSIKAVTGKPIKFVGVGEKLDALEAFHPERMASRILGMGDMLTLIEKAEATFEEEKAIELEKKLRKAQFTLEDFREQLQQIKKMGPLEGIMDMVPGMGKLKAKGLAMPEDKELTKIEAIINSMTQEERQNHLILNASRRQRIARGSGTKVQDVNRLVKRFTQAKKMMKRFSKMGMKGLGQGMPQF